MSAFSENTAAESFEVDSVDNLTVTLLRNGIHYVLVEHRHLLGLVAIYLAVGALILSQSRDHALSSLAVTYPLLIAGKFTVVASVAAMFTTGYLYRTRPAHPFSAVAQAFTQADVWPEMIARTAIIVVAAGLATGMFSAIKSEIPFVIPFTFDNFFVRLDETLHGGVQPWKLLHPILGNPWATDLLDRVYYLWFPVIFHTFYWQVFTRKRPVLRLQFLTAYLLCWMLIGSAAALTLSSAGPVFLSRLGADGQPYTELLNYLYSVGHEREIFALTVQDSLWQAYSHGIHTPFEGITAMPSMHVAIAVLLAIFGWHRHWALGLSYTLFAVLIFLGSIHLAFHYAVDGYIAAVMVVGIWLISGRIARRSLSGRAPAQAAQLS